MPTPPVPCLIAASGITDREVAEGAPHVTVCVSEGRVMARDGAVHPRWVLRSDARRAGRYRNDKVIRWIARPTLLKGREQRSDDTEIEDGNRAARARPNGFPNLRLVSES